VTKIKEDKPASAPRRGKIKVWVKQAHEETLPGGGFVRRWAGEEIEIAEKDFSKNLHEKIDPPSHKAMADKPKTTQREE